MAPFSVYPLFQPIMDLNSGMISHYEALARICGDVGHTLHQPLLQQLEAVGVIAKLDLAMLMRVLTLLGTHSNIKLSTNLSVKTVESAHGLVLRELHNFAPVCNRLTLEITESAPIENYCLVRRFCTAAKSQGCRISIDDFGRGYANLDRVQQLLPLLDAVKIDGELIQTAIGSKDQTSLDDLLSLVAHQKIPVVGEFIDTEDKLDFLRQRRIRYAQGYAISIPRRSIGPHKRYEIPLAFSPLEWQAF